MSGSTIVKRVIPSGQTAAKAVEDYCGNLGNAERLDTVACSAICPQPNTGSVDCINKLLQFCFNNKNVSRTTRKVVSVPTGTEPDLRSVDDYGILWAPECRDNVPKILDALAPVSTPANSLNGNNPAVVSSEAEKEQTVHNAITSFCTVYGSEGLKITKDPIQTRAGSAITVEDTAYAYGPFVAPVNFLATAPQLLNKPGTEASTLAGLNAIGADDDVVFDLKGTSTSTPAEIPPANDVVVLSITNAVNETQAGEGLSETPYVKEAAVFFFVRDSAGDPKISNAALELSYLDILSDVADGLKKAGAAGEATTRLVLRQKVTSGFSLRLPSEEIPMDLAARLSGRITAVNLFKSADTVADPDVVRVDLADVIVNMPQLFNPEVTDLTCGNTFNPLTPTADLNGANTSAGKTCRYLWYQAPYSEDPTLPRFKNFRVEVYRNYNEYKSTLPATALEILKLPAGAVASTAATPRDFVITLCACHLSNALDGQYQQFLQNESKGKRSKAAQQLIHSFSSPGSTTTTGPGSKGPTGTLRCAFPMCRSSLYPPPLKTSQDGSLCDNDVLCVQNMTLTVNQSGGSTIEGNVNATQACNSIVSSNAPSATASAGGDPPTVPDSDKPGITANGVNGALNRTKGRLESDFRHHKGLVVGLVVGGVGLVALAGIAFAISGKSKSHKPAAGAAKSA